MTSYFLLTLDVQPRKPEEFFVSQPIRTYGRCTKLP